MVDPHVGHDHGDAALPVNEADDLAAKVFTVYNTKAPADAQMDESEVDAMVSALKLTKETLLPRKYGALAGTTATTSGGTAATQAGLADRIRLYERIMSEFDADKSKSLSETEFAKLFRTYKVTYATMGVAKAENSHAGHDHGGVIFDEYDEMAEGAMSIYDSDFNGVLSTQEILDMLLRRRLTEAKLFEAGVKKAPWNPDWTALGATFVTCIISLVGALLMVPACKNCLNNKELIDNVSAFTSGVLVGVVLVHIVPEAETMAGNVAHDWKIGTPIISGVFFGILTHYLGGVCAKACCCLSPKSRRGRGSGSSSSSSSGSRHIKRDEVIPQGEPQKEEVDGEATAGAGAGAGESKPASSTAIVVKAGDAEAEVGGHAGAGPGAAPGHSHGGLSVPETEEDKFGLAVNIIVGDLFHNISDGILLAVAFSVCDAALGWSIMVAIILHELPQELVDFVVLLSCGLSWKVALFWNFMSSMSAFFACIIVLSINKMTPANKPDADPICC